MRVTHSLIHSFIHWALTPCHLPEAKASMMHEQHSSTDWATTATSASYTWSTRRKDMFARPACWCCCKPSLHVCLHLWQCGQARGAALRRVKHVRAGQTFPGHSQTPNLPAHQCGSGDAWQEAKPPRAVPKTRQPVHLKLIDRLLVHPTAVHACRSSQITRQPFFYHHHIMTEVWKNNNKSSFLE